VLVDRVEDARDAQQDAKESIQDAYTRFANVVNVKGGDLEKTYKNLQKAVDKSEARATEIDERIQSVEVVSGDLFREWKGELKQYKSANLRASSERQLENSEARYQQMITAMKTARRKIDPVLSVLKDNALFLKHNLNAKALAALKGEVVSIEGQVTDLIREMESAIAESERFIKEFEGG
jgi:ABC-type transporter Mla subunit MlaD